MEKPRGKFLAPGFSLELPGRMISSRGTEVEFGTRSQALDKNGNFLRKSSLSSRPNQGRELPQESSQPLGRTSVTMHNFPTFFSILLQLFSTPSKSRLSVFNPQLVNRRDILVPLKMAGDICTRIEEFSPVELNWASVR